MNFQFTDGCKGYKITTMPTIPIITMSYMTHDSYKKLDLKIMQFEMTEDKTKIVCSVCRQGITIRKSGIDLNDYCYWTEQKIEI